MQEIEPRGFFTIGCGFIEVGWVEGEFRFVLGTLELVEVWVLCWFD